MTKIIEIKKDNKTIIKIVPDNYVEPEYEIPQLDITTSLRRGIGFSDVPKEKWEKIFGKTVQDKR